MVFLQSLPVTVLDSTDNLGPILTSVVSLLAAAKTHSALDTLQALVTLSRTRGLYLIITNSNALTHRLLPPQRQQPAATLSLNLCRHACLALFRCANSFEKILQFLIVRFMFSPLLVGDLKARECVRYIIREGLAKRLAEGGQQQLLRLLIGLVPSAPVSNIALTLSLLQEIRFVSYTKELEFSLLSYQLSIVSLHNQLFAAPFRRRSC